MGFGKVMLRCVILNIEFLGNVFLRVFFWGLLVWQFCIQYLVVFFIGDFFFDFRMLKIVFSVKVVFKISFNNELFDCYFYVSEDFVFFVFII